MSSSHIAREISNQEEKKFSPFYEQDLSKDRVELVKSEFHIRVINISMFLLERRGKHMYVGTINICA